MNYDELTAYIAGRDENIERTWLKFGGKNQVLYAKSFGGDDQVIKAQLFEPYR